MLKLSKPLFFIGILAFVLWLQGCQKEGVSIDINAEPEDGVILTSPFKSTTGNTGTLLVLDKYGNTLTSKSLPSVGWNFEKWEIDGKTRYTYIEANNDAYHINSEIITPGWGVVLDENFNEIKRVGFSPMPGLENQTSVDTHDFIYLGDDHFITIAYIEKTVSNIPASLNPVANCKVVASVIQEVLNDRVIFQWDGTDYPEFYSQSVEGNNFSNASLMHDYMHINSVFVDPRDNNIICSFRQLNQVVKINRINGNVMWRLGGKNSDFAITADMKFLRQHDASLTDNNNTILIYDNGEATERAYTRVVEFKLDEEGKTITSFKATEVPDIFSKYMGSVQKRGETYFIGCGSEPRIIELNYNTGVVNFNMKFDNVSYRAYKY